jgi:hypothetical protein
MHTRLHNRLTSVIKARMDGLPRFAFRTTEVLFVLSPKANKTNLEVLLASERQKSTLQGALLRIG